MIKPINPAHDLKWVKQDLLYSPQKTQEVREVHEVREVRVVREVREVT
jgi:hypothetical protein